MFIRSHVADAETEAQKLWNNQPELGTTNGVELGFKSYYAECQKTCSFPCGLMSSQEKL